MIIKKTEQHSETDLHEKKSKRILRLIIYLYTAKNPLSLVTSPPSNGTVFICSTMMPVTYRPAKLNLNGKLASGRMENPDAANTLRSKSWGRDFFLE